MTAKKTPVRPEVFAEYANVPRILFNFGWGLNENTTPELDECGAGYNFDLAINQTSLIPRKPFDLKGTATNAGATTGLLQLVKRDNSETTLTVNGTQVYLWDGGSTFSPKKTVVAPALLRDAYWSLDDHLIISDINLNNVVAHWDGTTYTALTTGLAHALYAKYVIVHLNRVWLFNISYNSVLSPHMILASAFEDHATWDTATRGGASSVGGGAFATGLEAFFLLVPDLKPINGVTVFQNTLIISTTEGRMWQLTGTSSKDFQFVDFFDTEPAIGKESVTAIGNDVLFVGKGGEISLLSSTQQFGNVRTFSLSRWLPTTTANLSVINAIVYDILNQKVLIFTTGKVLVLFKDLLAIDRYQVRDGKSPWSVYLTDDSSGFNTSSAKYMKIPGTQNYSVFFGDSVGRIFNLNGTGTNDAGVNPINVSRTSRHIGTELINPWPWVDENITGHIHYHRNAQVNVTIALDWDDEYNTTSNIVTLKGPLPSDTTPYFGGLFYFGGTSYFGGTTLASRVSSINLDPGGKGPGFYMTVGVITSVPFQIDSLEWD